MVLDYALGQFESKSRLRLQESPDATAPGETPVNVACVSLRAQIQKEVQPGDRVVVTCIYRAAPQRLNGTQSLVRNQFKPFLDVLWVARARGGAGATLEQQMRVELERFRTRRAKADIPVDLQDMIPKTDKPDDERMLRLIRSVAPSVFGDQYLQIKLALLLQAVRGVPAEGQRANLHVLLVGDPGQAKSQLIKFMAKITPRAVYTSGKNSSQAGLTATVSKVNGELQMEPGALVLADDGLCALDEFDKLDQVVRGVLHECMEQQTVSIAKGGVVCTLRARTAVLAAANPVDSKYNPRKTVI